MINTECTVQDLDAIEVVHRQNGAALVFIADEGISQGFARLFISGQINIYYFTIPKLVLLEAQTLLPLL